MTGAPGDGAAPLQLSMSSFGYKYGPPPDVDCVFDARILDNPFWVPELRRFSGLEEPIRRWVLARPETTAFLDRVADLLSLTIGRARGQGRETLDVAVGCTGGRHRSPVVVTALADRLAGPEVEVTVHHRDVERDASA